MSWYALRTLLHSHRVPLQCALLYVLCTACTCHNGHGLFTKVTGMPIILIGHRGHCDGSRCVQVLVIESCQGLITASCAERMAGHGALCAVSTTGKPPPLDALRLMNLSEQDRSIICTASLGDLLTAKVTPVDSVPRDFSLLCWVLHKATECKQELLDCTLLPVVQGCSRRDLMI